MRGGTGGSSDGDDTVSMIATDACLMRLGFSGGGLEPGCNPSGLPFSVGCRGRTMFGAEREVDGLVRPEGTASSE